MQLRLLAGRNHDSSDNATKENQAPRAQVSILKAAILRINAAIDIDTVLGKAVESARTGTRNRAIVTVGRVPPAPRVLGPHGEARNANSSPGRAKTACPSSPHPAWASVGGRLSGPCPRVRNGVRNSIRAGRTLR